MMHRPFSSPPFSGPARLRLKCLSYGLLGAMLLSSCQGRPRQTEEAPGSPRKGGLFASLGRKKARVLDIDLSHGIPEASAGGLVPTPAKRTYLGLVRSLDAALVEESVAGVFVRLGEGDLGWAHTEELGPLFGKLRARGKPVVCHAHSLGNQGAWLAAAACDRIWLSPAGGVDSVGIAGQVMYLKGALDRFKVRADFVHIGEFKSAAEALTREGPSDAARLALTETLTSIRQSWLDGVTHARKAVKEPTITLEHGPYGPEDAKARGLIDEIGYESEALRDAQQRSKTQDLKAGFGRSGKGDELDLAEIIRTLAGSDESKSGRPRIAVLPAVGAISMVPGGMMEAGGIVERPITKVIRRLANDDLVKAVVLRIDSPGGSALASDLIWHDLMELRKKKPIIASVASMAASGGYYLACTANRIVAERTSIVGSIGVVGGKITLDEALGEFGINTVTFPASPDPEAARRAGYLSPMTPWDDPTREQIKRQMTQIYELFLRRVAEGRGRPVDHFRKIAEGRIWSGVQGKNNGLVDEFGGLSRALEIARDLGHLGADAPVSLEGQEESLLEQLFGSDDAPDAQALTTDVVTRRLAELEARRLPWTRTLSAPLRAHLAALEPLAHGEVVLTAVPMAFTLR